MFDEIFQDSDTPPTPVDRRSADIGLVCTHRAEVRPLLKMLDRVRSYTDGGMVFRGGFLDESIRIAIVEAGPGFANHRLATEVLLEEHHPVWVLSVGFSSGLSDVVSAGDVCLANRISDTHGNSLTLNCPIPESRRIFVRPHLVADTHPMTSAEKRRLAETFDADAVDTTSAAVAQVCSETVEAADATTPPETTAAERPPAGTSDPAVDSTSVPTDTAAPSVPEKPPAPARARFLSVRVIIDGVDEDLTEQAVELIFAPAGTKKRSFGDVVRDTFRKDPERAKWEQRMVEASKNLHRFLPGVLRQLGEKLHR